MTTGADLRLRAGLEVRWFLERQLEPLGRAAMTTLSPRPGETVLDVGCGTGGTPRALAAAVGQGGRVVGLDIQRAAIDVAAADPDPPSNLSWLCADAATFPFEPASFDAVFSRFGVMTFTDPVDAFANIRRGLGPGGRLAFVCWRALAENEVDALPLSAAAPALPAEFVAEAAASGPFSFADPETTHDVLGRAGFTDVSITAHDTPTACGDLGATVAVCARVGALGKILREYPQYRDEAVTRLAGALAPLDSPAGLFLQAATWVVAARAPR